MNIQEYVSLPRCYSCGEICESYFVDDKELTSAELNFGIKGKLYCETCYKELKR